MSIPQILTSNKILNIVKNRLEENPNFEVIQQVPYFNKPSALPSLKTLSFILYKDLLENSYKIAQSNNLEINHLSINEFKNISQEELSPQSIKDFQNLCTTIESLLTPKKTIKP